MICFVNNYLEDLPKELQLNIMDEVSKLDKQEKDIIKKIMMICYKAWCEGDPLYKDIDSLIKYKCKDGVETGFLNLDKTIRENVYRDDWIEEDGVIGKKYIMNTMGVFKALRIYKEMGFEQNLMEMIEYDDEGRDLSKFSNLYQVLVAHELKKLFSELDWEMIYNYKLYNKYIDSLDLDGIDTPD